MRPLLSRRVRLAFALFLVACSGGGDSGTVAGTPTDGGGGGGGACPNLAGNWKVTQHCDTSLVGQSASATQKDCTLTFAAPFDGFTGTVTSDGKISMSGPQTCTGTASASSIVLTCTPGTCAVTLGH
jgi:hypothetical protein